MVVYSLLATATVEEKMKVHIKAVLRFDIIKQGAEPKAATSAAFPVLASFRDCSLIDISRCGIHFSALNQSHLESIIKKETS